MVTSTVLAALLALGQAPQHTIAFVPTDNLSSEKWQALKANQDKKIAEYLSDTFGKRGFTIAPADAIAAKLTAAKVDLTDEDQPKRPFLTQLGKDLGVEFVIYEQVISTEQKEQERFLYKDTEGVCNVKLWLIDVNSEKSIVGGKVFIGRSGGSRAFAISNKGSERQIQAAANAVANGLKEFLKDFPVNNDKAPKGEKPPVGQPTGDTGAAGN